MESQAAAEMSLHDISMSSTDLIDKTEIDSGGFGKVYLCCHRTRGLVVLKTVFTGFKHDSYNKALREEGEIMYKLNHERIVKLLGLILEGGNYSLVIEYMPKGNLLNLLKQITVADSVKARIILEIIEGMVYLHNQNVIHKDLKPENILVEDEFHIKIADLGVAAFQKWSTLTKEETARQRRSSRISATDNTSNAGTLCYMAPEHLQCINKKATIKSDVYSFGIVIWVVLNNKEPYENAINSTQIIHCVISGQRPEVDTDLDSNLKEAIDLMQECWKGEPADRPSFTDCENIFRTIYTEKHEKAIESEVAAMKISYPKPNVIVERMASLQIDCDAEAPSMPSRDHPQSLHSTVDLAHGHVNEGMFAASTNEHGEHEQQNPDEALQRKLQEEMNYHQTGSRIDNGLYHSNPPTSSGVRSRKVFNEMKCESSNIVQPGHPASDYTQDSSLYGPDILGSGTGYVGYPLSNEPPNMFYPPHPAMQFSTPSTIFPSVAHPSENIPWHQQPRIDPYSSTKVPVAESMAFPPLQNPNISLIGDTGHIGGVMGSSPLLKGNFGYSHQYIPERSVNLTISNSKAIQIGNNNVMTVEGETYTKETAYDIQQEYCNVFESSALINECQLQLLRENLSKKWKEFARIVGFRQPEIEEIDHDFERDGLKEKVYQMLHKWQMKEGSKNSTVGKVATALSSLRETDLLNQLIGLNDNM